jgi:hypothetical protein|tara:strand:- start:7348 stop:7962 length:615 start_codon:yes stop_codon:yes gene_type:complete
MATSAQIKGYAKQHNCSKEEARAHFVKQATKDFLFSTPKSTEGFKPDAGISMKTNKAPGVVINVSQFVAGSIETEKKFGGRMYNPWKDGIEITETVGVIGNEESEGTDFCGTMWFSKEMINAFCTEISKGAFNIEISGTPKAKVESVHVGDIFRPIEVTEVKTRGCYSNAGGEFRTMCLDGGITHGKFAQGLLTAVNNPVKVAS